MSKYIKMNKALDELKLAYDDIVYIDKRETAEQILKLPSIDIVRCKECKHNPWDFDRTDFTCVWDDDFADRPQTPDDFCSYGDKRE